MKDNTTYDAVIIGGGHNGLVCGTYLAKDGYKVLVLERRELLGGASVTEELWPGYRVNTAAHMLGLMQPKIVLELELQKFGYDVIPVPPGVHLVEGTGPVVLWKDMDRLCKEFARFSARDAEAYPKYHAHLAQVAPPLRDLMWEIPFDPTDLSPANLARMVGFAWRNRKGLAKFHDISDLMTMSAYDYLARWFESEEVRIICGYYPAGAAGQSVSIHTPGTAYFLLRNHLRPDIKAAGGTGLARGGMGNIPEAIAKSGARFGLQTRTNAEVDEVLIHEGRAVGVQLTDGSVIKARAVISNAAAQHLFADLVAHEATPEAFRQEVQHIHGQATTFKIHLAVDQPIPFEGLERAGYEHGNPVQVTLAPSIRYMEQAYHEMHQGKLSERPYMTIQTPTLADPSLAPEGKHLLSIYGGHVPYGDGVQDDVLREKIFETVLDTISIYAPKFDRRWNHRQIMLSSDYETIFRLPGGSPHHGDLTLDQLFFRRPVRKFADYMTPVKGLFLCGASSHPGGGVSGVPGYNAARVIGRALKAKG